MRKKVTDVFGLPDEAMLTVRQAAMLMNVSSAYLRQLFDSGEMQVVTWGKTKEPRVPRWYIRDWQKKRLAQMDESIDRILKIAETRRVAR